MMRKWIKCATTTPTPATTMLPSVNHATAPISPLKVTIISSINHFELWDKTVKIWAIENGSSVKQLTTLPPFNSSVTALSWAGLDHLNGNGVLAIGMESGLIELWALSFNRPGDGSSLAVSGLTATLATRFDPFVCHVSAVHRLAWRNLEKSPDSGTMELASCGADHSVRVFE
ncbi:hypothetical protein U1Q18_002247, partial [Sarracenia purpurea var. burkii]